MLLLLNEKYSFRFDDEFKSYTKDRHSFSNRLDETYCSQMNQILLSDLMRCRNINWVGHDTRIRGGQYSSVVGWSRAHFCVFYT